MAEGKDFFVSYTGANEAWAVWIAVELERAGYTTVTQALDFRPGQDFVHLMQEAATRTIAVVSPAYESSEFGEAEWRAALAEDPSGQAGRLVPVRVQECRPTGLLRSRIAVDLVGLDEDAAREALLTGVGPASPRPTRAPFPNAPAPDRFPGAGPAVSNLGRRRRSGSRRCTGSARPSWRASSPTASRATTR